MVRLKKGPPLLQKIKVPNSRNNNVQLIDQRRRYGGRRHRHGGGDVDGMRGVCGEL
ncbi:hypothetical protein Hanom_Chr12g01179801 [Helianthus anomalus]